ncbi:helix-turn-helix domain-containing protein [Kitasatospora cineracea]|uniref:AraC family transcriptional regulator n=1 Tax=Kitasatospora cineracea TaxID=88074 RepID=A0A8G1XFG2_9ACTN|nr:helix-turn-helix domain-containing protein [Kitasatospora cineracea]ROR46386.1 AraC family transcriptional regulator [Kitasatospora cineracea]
MRHRPAPVSVASGTERVVCGRFEEDSSYRTVRPGGTNDWVVFATVAGQGLLRVEGAPEITVDRSRIVAVEPRVPHRYRTDPGTDLWSFRWAHLLPRPDWTALLDWPTAAPGVRAVRVDDTSRTRIVHALDRAISARRSGLRRGPQFMTNAVEEALLWCDALNPREPVLDPRLMAALEFAGERLDEPHSVASLAAVAGLSQSRLSHLARKQLGTGLMAHVESQRLEQARHLLALTDLHVAQVARRVGFPDPLYFSRRFHAATGMSPTRFRSTDRQARA